MPSVLYDSMNQAVSYWPSAPNNSNSSGFRAINPLPPGYPTGLNQPVLYGALQYNNTKSTVKYLVHQIFNTLI